MQHNTDIRVYKSVSLRGETVYTTKSSDNRGDTNQLTLSGIAREIKEKHEKLDPMTQLTVDFKPFHDLECPSDLAPHRCLPLTEEDQNEFWSELGKLYQ